MTTLSYCGYHTCKLEGGYEHVSSSVPFLSNPSNNQWLTQGFYFWTDDDYWAKKWGKVGRRVIGKFTIDLCPKTELLDLVGNVSDQRAFVAYKDRLLKTLTPDQRKQITVNQIISWCRQEEKTYSGLFPYLAVKAEDGRNVEEIRFVDPAFDRWNRKQALITPQQLCVFEQAKSRIRLDGFIEPDDYSQKRPVLSE